MFAKFKMNRRGDVSITLLVFLILFLIGATMFIFITNSNKVGALIGDSRFLDASFYESSRVKFYLESAAEKAVFDGYQNVLNRQGLISLDSFDENDFSSQVKSEILNNFENEKEPYGLTDIKLKNVEISGDSFVFSFGDFPIVATLSDKDNNEISRAIYRPSIIFETNVTVLGLYDMSFVKRVILGCADVKETAGLQACVAENLPNFNVSAGEIGKNGERAVYLLSKRKFFIGSQLRELVFSVGI